MSLCIRSISSGSRYVPTIVVASAHQGCIQPRSFSSRHSPKHVKSIATSSFLSEFLVSNVPITSSLNSAENYKPSHVSRDLSNQTYPQSCSTQVNYLLNRYNIDSISSKSPSNGDYKLSSQNISQTMCKTRNSLVFSNCSESSESWILFSSQDRSVFNDNHRTNLTSVGMSTKDKTKAIFSTVTKHASVLKEKNMDSSTTKKTQTNRKPSMEDLEHVYETIRTDLPNFFSKSIDYTIYSPEIEFVNNIRGLTSKGLYPYIKQLAFIRTVGHIKFAYVRLEVLKITMHTQDNTIRVRWRINGITGMKVLFSFWKFRVWKIRDEALKQQESWYDGFSTFYVGEDGLVYKHVADKMMPDENLEDDKPKTIPSKLASQLTFSSID